MERRIFLVGSMAAAASFVLSPEVGLARPAPAHVVLNGQIPARTIVVENRLRRLMLGLGNGTSISYPVAVGRVAKQWSGTTHVVRMERNPIWQPPEIVRRDSPHLPALVPPGPSNPLGTRAIVLARPEYAIHGTNAPHSIGTAASYGCFRMFNADVEDLFQRIGIGTAVVVV